MRPPRSNRLTDLCDGDSDTINDTIDEIAESESAVSEEVSEGRAPALEGGSAGINLVGQYLKEIRHISRLTPKDELRLARRVAKGDSAARKRMVEANLGLVISIGRRYFHVGLPVSDIIAEGNLGLIKAVERFNPELGFRFSTYAVWWIRSAVMRAIMEHGTAVHLPVHLNEQIRKYLAELGSLVQILGHEPDLPAICKHLNWSKAQVIQIQQLLQNTHAPDVLEEDRRGIALPSASGDRVSAAYQAEGIERREHIFRWLERLTKRERQVLVLRYGLEGDDSKTMSDVARMLSLSRERVRQLEGAGLKKLRCMMKAV